MDALLKSDKAMDILAGISLAQFIVIIVLLTGITILAFRFKDSLKNFLEDYREKENGKENWKKQVERHENEIKELKKHHDKDIDKFYNKQLEFRQQSLNKQSDIDNRFNDINTKIDNLTQMLIEQHEETKLLKRNELREKLLSSYRYYTSLEQNPTQSWNEMEAEAFWHLFKDYERLKGNGFIHTTVKPAMEKLTVISIY